MGIYIPNMKMPKSCDVCPFVRTNDDLRSDDYRYLYCGFPYMGQYVTDYQASRHPNCPLVPPLTEGHGRLRDLDTLGKFLHEKENEADNEEFYLAEAWYNTFRHILRVTPTVVSAEVGGKDA